MSIGPQTQDGTAVPCCMPSRSSYIVVGGNSSTVADCNVYYYAPPQPEPAPAQKPKVREYHDAVLFVNKARRPAPKIGVDFYARSHC